MKLNSSCLRLQELGLQAHYSAWPSQIFSKQEITIGTVFPLHRSLNKRKTLKTYSLSSKRRLAQSTPFTVVFPPLLSFCPKSPFKRFYDKQCLLCHQLMQIITCRRLLYLSEQKMQESTWKAKAHFQVLGKTHAPDDRSLQSSAADPCPTPHRGPLYP